MRSPPHVPFAHKAPHCYSVITCSHYILRVCFFKAGNTRIIEIYTGALPMKKAFILCGLTGWCMEILWTGLHSILQENLP